MAVLFTQQQLRYSLLLLTAACKTRRWHASLLERRRRVHAWPVHRAWPRSVLE